MRALMLAAVMAAAICVSACASAHIECPEDGSTTTVAIGGSTVGLQLLAAGLQAAKVAGFIREAPAAAAPAAGSAAPVTSHVDYSYVPIFGNDFVSCAGHVQPASAPTPAPAVIVVPNGSHAEIVK